MASGEARCVGGRGHSQPCGRSDGPARPREDALLEAERLYHRRLLDHLHEEIHGETMRCEERDFENRNLRWQLDHRNGIVAQEHARAVRAEERVGELERSIDIPRWRLERRVKVLKEENEDLCERAVLAEVRVDELEEDLDRARGTR